MKKFGYINDDSDEEPSEDDLKKAVLMMQKFGHLPETGVLDKKTLTLAKTPRCGLKDVERSEDGVYNYILDGGGWNKKNLSYFLTNTTRLSQKTVMENIKKGLKLWESVSPLRFFPARSEYTADIRITFFHGDHGFPWDNAFDGKGGVLAHAWSPKPGRLLSGDIHFDADENWIDKAKVKGRWEGIDFYTTFVHELGHCLGLDHSEKNDSVMSPYYTDYKDSLKLGYDDALAMYKLYVDNGMFDEDNQIPPPDPKDYYKPLPSTEHDCEGSFDAVLFFTGYVTFFKGDIFWEMEEESGTNRGYWYFRNHLKFKKHIKKIDAAYTRNTDGKAVFFTGKHYWVFVGGKPERDSPQPLTNLGLPRNLKNIDAAMNWRKDGKTYFFHDNQYWCYNEQYQRMEEEYPRSMRDWKGAPYNIDCALSLRNGSTYFFKDRYYWEVDDHKHLIDPSRPKSSKHWLGDCN